MERAGMEECQRKESKISGAVGKGGERHGATQHDFPGTGRKRGKDGMKTVSIMNLKGGVGKTVSAVTIAYLLAEREFRVLLVDNDKQGNASKMLDMYRNGKPGMAYVMTERLPVMAAVVQRTKYAKLDIITADMSLLTANLTVQIDQQRPQHTRIKKALDKVAGDYDFCVIDNAPDINISTANALYASDFVMIPLTMDEFAMDGLAELTEQISAVQEEMNPNLRLLGCFVTRYVKRDEAERSGLEYLKKSGYPVFETVIRRTAKVVPATFLRMPVPEYSERCAASVDYGKLVDEFLERSGEHEQ